MMSAVLWAIAVAAELPTLVQAGGIIRSDAVAGSNQEDDVFRLAGDRRPGYFIREGFLASNQLLSFCRTLVACPTALVPGLSGSEKYRQIFSSEDMGRAVAAKACTAYNAML